MQVSHNHIVNIDIVGDYHLALKVLENVELNTKGLYSRVPKCQITIYYYVGFCYLMMRRYHV